MTEPCLVCRGRGVREDGSTCAYCDGGRVAVKAGGDRSVWVATGSCKVPAKKVQMGGAAAQSGPGKPGANR